MKTKKKIGLLIMSVALLLLLQSCDFFADLLSEFKEGAQAVKVINKTNAPLFYMINHRGEISTKNVMGEYYFTEVLPDSVSIFGSDDLEEHPIAIVVLREDTYNKYSIDEIRDNNIYDYGVIYTYKVLQRMEFTIEITEDVVSQRALCETIGSIGF